MKYKITFYTGMQSGSGTDADISFQILGSKSNSKAIALTSKLKQFEKGSIDIFYFESVNLGDLEKIKVWHNNKLLAAKWFLNELTIEVNKQKKLWYFPVNKWIKKDKRVTVSSVKSTVYDFEITTGTLPGSGTQDNIQISLIGSKTYSNFFDLNSKLSEKEFKTGHTDSFSLLQEDVGKIEEIKIKSINSTFSSNWFLSKLKIKKSSEKNFETFPFQNWIKPSKIYSTNKNLIEYTIKFHTGDVAAGGTDANVSMIVFGTRGETKPIHLNELIARNAFEAGKTDYVKLAHKNLGSVKKINIWHDEKWAGDGWFLNKIEVKNDETGVTAESTNIELTRMPIQPRPFYTIAHMVNTPAYTEEALDLGSNAVEFDVMPNISEDENITFDVFHGFRPDFDPDKINLMERSLARTELPIFLKSLQGFEEKYKNFSLAIYDCKLKNVPQNKLESCGRQLAEEVITKFYGDDDIGRIYTIFSIGKKKSAPFFDGIVKVLPKNLLPLIGFDLSMENFQTTEKLFENKNGINFWWGSGIASTVPKPLRHFIPQFLIAAKKRTKRGVIKKIYYWTLDDPDSMARMLVTKLDGIIVNDPLKLLKVLEKEEFKHSYRLATRNDNPFSVI